MYNFEFKDTKVNNPNRKKLTIVSQAANELIADITFAEPLEEAGTILNAEMLNCFQDKINKSVADAESANKNSVTAQVEASTALEVAHTASITADEAKQIAENSIRIASAAQEQVVEVQGTKVYADGQLLSVYDIGSKVDVAQTLENANKVLVTDEMGNVKPSNVVPIGHIKCYEEQDAITGEVILTIEFPSA